MDLLKIALLILKGSYLVFSTDTDHTQLCTSTAALLSGDVLCINT